MEEFELHIIKFPELPGAAEWRAEVERHRAEARRRSVAHLAAVLAERSPATGVEALAAAVLDRLAVWNDVASGERCSCSCHPRLPDSDVHDYGFDCTCQQTPQERRARTSAWRATIDEFWDTDEGRRLTAARQAEEDELAAWLTDHPDVVVHRHGGMAPEQWQGKVDGHSFYFRERHDHWRVELDLRPSGRYYRAWTGGDLDDDANYERRETEEGDVIAEGTTGDAGYGHTPVERIQFIAATIRSHLRRQRCTLHVTARADLDALFGPELAWCPACGTRLIHNA